MELKIFWTEFAKNEPRNIFDFYKIVAGTNIARKIVNKITSETKYLIKQPKMGQIELELEQRNNEFRYLVCMACISK